MKTLKLFSLALMISLVGGFLLPTTVQAEETNELANVLVEFETDEISAESLGIEEPTVLPGDKTYWWQNIKDNVGLFLTFDEEKKILKMEQLASRKLLEAKKLTGSGTDNAAENVEKSLEKYNEVMRKVTERLQNNPNIKTKILENFDTKQLRHQELLRNVTEKLRSKISNDKIEKFERIRKENAERLHQIDPENFEARLKKAVDNNNLGSKFKALRNIATLEDIQNSVNQETKEKIEAAKENAQEKLADKLQSLDAEEKEKLGKYIENIKLPIVQKQALVNDLKNSEKIPETAKIKIRQISNTYSEQMKERWNNFDADGQKKFLEQFESRSHPTYINFLDNIKVPEELRERVKNLRETQIQGIKEKIQNTNDLPKLRSLQQNVKDPVLLREIRTRQVQVTPTRSGGAMMQNQQATDNRQ
ncbi:DUF5667 domain-containing protein [bacterium]|nr:DUF5667 domain-containing protein [bacterium]